MGSGYVLQCKKCHRKMELMLGTGWVTNKRKLSGSLPSVHVTPDDDAMISDEQTAYYCRACRHLFVEPSGTVTKTYVDKVTKKTRTKVLFFQRHRCPLCGKVARKMTEAQIFDGDFKLKLNVNCPKCRKGRMIMPAMHEMFQWD